MRRLRFEEKPKDPAILVAWLLGAAAALAGCLWAGWVAGCLGFLLLASLVLVFAETARNVSIPGEAGPAAEKAVEAARQKYPGEEPWGVEVRAVEPGRFVFTLRYKRGWQDLRRYFVVGRTDPATVTEVEEANGCGP